MAGGSGGVWESVNDAAKNADAAAQDYSNRAGNQLDKVVSAINSLLTEGGSLPDPPQLGDVNEKFTLPDEPEFSKFYPGNFAPPTAHPGRGPNPTTGSFSAPVLDATAPLRPTVSFGNPPQTFNRQPPQAPASLHTSELAIPAAPSLQLPAAPTLNLVDPNIAAPALEFPQFPATKPAAPGTPPNVSIEFDEEFYDSAELRTLYDRLADWVGNGGATGLDPTVEQQLWDRARSRDHAEYQRNRREALEGFAARGYELPPGALAGRLMQVEQEASDKESTASREIAIEQARLAQQNMQFAITQLGQLESKRMDYASQVAQRALEVQKAMVSAAIDVYNAKISKFNAEVEAYQTEAQVWRERIQAELAKLEEFRQRIEAEKLKGEVEERKVRVYSAQLEALNTKVGVYNAQVQAAKIRADVLMTRFEAYRSQIDGFKAEVDANRSEFEAYEARIRGELGKIEAHKADADVFKGFVDAYRSEVEAEKSIQEGNIALDELRLRTHQADIEAYSEGVRSESARFEAMTRGLQGLTEVYRGRRDVRTTEADFGLRERIANIENTAKQYELNLNNAGLKQRYASDKAEALASAYKEMGKISAQIASAAFSAVSVSGSVSARDFYDVNKDVPSTSHRYNYNM